jgi:hypothetical protein
MGIFSSVLVGVGFIDAVTYSKSDVGVHSSHAIIFHQFRLKSNSILLFKCESYE